MKTRKKKLVLAVLFLLLFLLAPFGFTKQDFKNNELFQSPIAKSRNDYMQHFHREPPIGFDLWAQFAADKNCTLNLTFYSQIYRDLKPWTHENFDLNIAHVKERFLNTSKDYFDNGYIMQGRFNASSKLFSNGNRQTLELLNSVGHLVHYDFDYLLNNLDEPISLPADNGQERVYHSMSDVINSSACLQNIGQSILDSHGFFIAPNSKNPFSFNGLLPIFSQAKHHCYKDILVPNKFGQPWEKYHRIRLLEWEKKYAQKHPKFVFDAGKMSESLHELADHQGQFSPNLFVDIGLYSYVHYDQKTLKIFQNKYPVKNRVSFEKTMKFKYLLVVDGNTWASRIQSYLQTNSVILYNGVFTDHYLWMLKPWVHYVPIRTDLQDLDEKLEWLISNDEKARSIAENARTLMRKLGRYEHLQCYTGLLMQEFGRIFGRPLNSKSFH